MFESCKNQVYLITESIKNISFGSDIISFLLKYSNRKTLGIKVYPDSSIIVIAPNNSKESDILKKVHSKVPWIIRQQLNFQSYHPFTPTRKFVNGESHLYLGRQYKLRLVISNENKIKISAGQIFFSTKNTDPTYLENLLKSWYKIRAQKIFNEVVSASFEQFHRYKIPFPIIQIRHMNKRWGSCSPSGKIILNQELIKAPKASIEYVIIHELCHLVHPNHTKA
jgi:predicted metal-dependent hydrolase